MRSFYTAPTATVAASPPAAHFHALVCPGLPQWSIVVVDEWRDPASEDAWEDLPQVTQHFPENMGGLAPPVVINAFAPIGAVTGMTLRQVFRLIRASWPQWRD